MHIAPIAKHESKGVHLVAITHAGKHYIHVNPFIQEWQKRNFSYIIHTLASRNWWIEIEIGERSALGLFGMKLRVTFDVASTSPCVSQENSLKGEPRSLPDVALASFDMHPLIYWFNILLTAIAFSWFSFPRILFSKCFWLKGNLKFFFMIVQVRVVLKRTILSVGNWCFTTPEQNLSSLSSWLNWWLPPRLLRCQLPSLTTVLFRAFLT